MNRTFSKFTCASLVLGSLLVGCGTTGSDTAQNTENSSTSANSNANNNANNGNNNTNNPTPLSPAEFLAIRDADFGIENNILELINTDGSLTQLGGVKKTAVALQARVPNTNNFFSFFTEILGGLSMGIIGSSINPATGAVSQFGTPLALTPPSSGAYLGGQVTVTANGSRLYALTQFNLLQYSIASNGNLTEDTTGNLTLADITNPFATPKQYDESRLVANDSAILAIENTQISTQFETFVIDPATGHATGPIMQNPTPAILGSLSRVRGTAFSKDGKFLYTVTQTGNFSNGGNNIVPLSQQIDVYQISANGQLVSFPNLSVTVPPGGGSAASFVLTPQGFLILETVDNSNQPSNLYVFQTNTNSGAMTQVAGSPFPSRLNSFYGGLVASSNGYVYGSARPGLIDVYRVSSAGALTFVKSESYQQESGFPGDVSGTFNLVPKSLEKKRSIRILGQ